MNYTMITNHAHACTNTPPFPPRETRIQKNRFRHTNFCKFRDQQNHKCICSLNMVQPMSEQDKNETVQILNKMVHLKYPILEVWCCQKHITQLPPSKLKFDTKLRKVSPNNLLPPFQNIVDFFEIGRFPKNEKYPQNQKKM